MRRTAYLKALDEANKLPDDLKELEYFQGQVLIHPRSEVIGRIKTAARKDDKLLHCELIDVLNWEPPNDTEES